MSMICCVRAQIGKLGPDNRGTAGNRRNQRFYKMGDARSRRAAACECLCVCVCVCGRGLKVDLLYVKLNGVISERH